MLIALDAHYMSRMNLKLMKIVKFSLVGKKNPTAFLLKKKKPLCYRDGFSHLYLAM